jgi:hypothetical protein
VQVGSSKIILTGYFESFGSAGTEYFIDFIATEWVLPYGVGEE